MIDELGDYNKLIEELAELEHKQWIDWTRAVSLSENISSTTVERWEKLWCPFSELPERQKNADRSYAREVVKLLRKKGYLK